MSDLPIRKPNVDTVSSHSNGIKLSVLLAVSCWTSVIILTWLFIAGYVEVIWFPNGAAWFFFLLVGICAAAIASK